MLRYVSVIFSSTNNNYRYLLIDEIENGIHYTAQKEVWQMLFKLCQHFDIQLFATTHSREMITAFEEVCEEFEGEGAYFEMARHAKTNQIIGIKHEIATLEYELETNTAIRGE
jgi:AAA15 family ATPase/GTPase